jgi:hypothetical protein
MWIIVFCEKKRSKSKIAVKNSDFLNKAFFQHFTTNKRLQNFTNERLIQVSSSRSVNGLPISLFTGLTLIGSLATDRCANGTNHGIAG